MDDDVAGAGPSAEVKQDIEKVLTKYSGRYVGEVDGRMFLGMMNKHDRERGEIHISQTLPRCSDPDGLRLPSG